MENMNKKMNKNFLKKVFFDSFLKIQKNLEKETVTKVFNIKKLK